MRLMFATVKTAAVVTLFVYISSCMAYETSSPHDVVKIRESSATSTFLKSDTTDSVETLSDEERVPPFVEKIEDLLDSNKFGLETADYRSLKEEMHANNPSDPFGGTLTRLRGMSGDAAVVEMIIRAASIPETKDESQLLTRRLIVQYLHEEGRSMTDVCRLLEITKPDNVIEALKGPLFNTWAGLIIVFAHHRVKSSLDTLAHLVHEKKRLQDLTMKLKAPEYADESLLVARTTHESIVKELDEGSKAFNRALTEHSADMERIKEANDIAFREIREVLIEKYNVESVEAGLLKLRKVFDKQYDEIKAGL